MTQPERVSFLKDSEEPKPQNLYAPYPFTVTSLQSEGLQEGVTYTLDRFTQWKEQNRTNIESFLLTCHDQFDRLITEQRPRARFTRLFPKVRQEYQQQHVEQELVIFSLRNMAEVPDPEKIARFATRALQHEHSFTRSLKNDGDVMGTLARHFSLPPDHPALEAISHQLTTLQEVLPETVIRNGAMGKVVRTMLGVGTIAAYDQFDSGEKSSEDFLRILRGAAVYGSVYAVIDDTLQDLKAHTLSREEKQRLHETILQGLKTGEAIPINSLPDHPVLELISELYDVLRSQYPVQTYPELYATASEMYLAQDREMALDPALPHLSTDLYPDMFTKAGMTRVIANLLTDRELDPTFYSRCLNSMFLHQLRDDLVDYHEDLEAERVTPFTLPVTNEKENPLYDVFAYDAYTAATIFPGTEETLAHSQAAFLTSYFSRSPEHAERIIKKFAPVSSPSLQDLLRKTASVPTDTLFRITPIDQKVKQIIAEKSAEREQTEIDPRTFILDRIGSLNSLISEYVAQERGKQPENELLSIMQYALESGGKRLRPALTLMLAESLGLDASPLTPLLLSSEIFHSASLLFDDLPWQDNTPLRRGKPAAHIVYEPVQVEMAGVSMLFSGIYLLQELEKQHPADRVTAVTAYMTEAMQAICLGQDRDLQLRKRDATEGSLPDLLEIYRLKTATALEASLVPVMILAERSEAEINLIKDYAYHAGLVFQLRDDILDANEPNAHSALTLLGYAETESLIATHVEEAIHACQELPFNTQLLQKMVRYFANRRQ
jgi:geranylgeranyl pyrophosphate synthase